MSQDVDVQLKVWKDLAISKQILMGAATDALGLDAECSTEELKTALNEAIKRAQDADINIQETRNHAEQQVKEFRERAEGRPDDLPGLYLRLPEIVEPLCSDCHGPESLMLYKFFHSEVSR